MSFEDLRGSPSISAPSTLGFDNTDNLYSSPQSEQAQSAISTSIELHRLLKPLTLNNAALRATTRELSQSTIPSSVMLKRMRALRDQNRHISSAAAALVTATSDASDHLKLKSLLEEFQDALTESITVERNVLLRIQSNHPNEMSNGNTSATTSTSSSDHSLSKEHRQVVDETFQLIEREQQQQQQQQNYESIDMRDVFINERSDTLSQIQASVDDVNTIFKDLATMVSDQRSQVDYIEVNLDESSQQIQLARRQLEKTRRRRNARKSLFFCTLIVIAFVIAIFIIILLT